MRTEFHKTQDLIGDEDKPAVAVPPIPLSVIPNYMAINLVAVEGLSWTKQDDGQLVSLTIHFIPEEKT